MMKITIIHGQSHQGSTYHIARSLAQKLNGTITEFFLPKDFGEFCIGCTSCFQVSETKCPHFEKLSPITKALDNADVMILASPVYVYHATGAMKSLLDHYGWRWMVHRPEEKMFSKQAVCISTAAGAGTKSTNKDMAHSTFFWGIAKTYQFGTAVMETSWKRVSSKKKQHIERKLNALAKKIRKNQNHVKPSVKTKIFFYFMCLMQKHGWNKADTDYWKTKGWTIKNIHGTKILFKNTEKYMVINSLHPYFYFISGKMASIFHSFAGRITALAPIISLTIYSSKLCLCLK